MSIKAIKPTIAAKVSAEEAERIDARRKELGHETLSDYLRDLISRDLAEGGDGNRSLRKDVQAALAPAVYVLLSCLRRVASSEQALAVVERVYLSGDAARELEEHLTRSRAVEDRAPAPEPTGEEVAP